MATKRKQPKSPMLKYTLEDFNLRFPSDDACLDWLRHKLYPAKIYCPDCKMPTKHHRITSRKVYGCAQCGHQISTTAGTIFDHSPTPLTKWFYAIYLMSQTRGSISAKQLQRELGVTYKTAWRMFTLIRSRLDQGQSPLSGNVEVDESYFGGKHSGKRGRGASGKTPVIGAAQRKGQVKAIAVPNVQSKTVLPIVQENVEPGSTIHTDEYQIYNPLKSLGYEHNRILHLMKIYVMGNVHTQTIEGFWALVKNGIVGMYHHVSAKYLQNYLNEYTFRYGSTWEARS